MRFEDMDLETLKAYKAAVEVYGTSAELVEVCERLQELE